MVAAIAGIGVAVAVAGAVYLRLESLGREGLGLAALRATGLAAVILLLWNPGCVERDSDAPPIVLLDRSLSMGVAGGQWRAALDSARALAGPDGTVLGFGTTVGTLTDTIPQDGFSRIREALGGTGAMGRPVVVVTDGELTDAGALPPEIFRNVETVLLPREPVPGAALVGVEVPQRVQLVDTITVAVRIALWGELSAPSLQVELQVEGRRLAAETFAIPQTPSMMQRSLLFPARLLDAGPQIVDVTLSVDGDPESRDNVRRRVIVVTDQPTVVLIVDPADWEGRYLLGILSDVAGVPVRGFARIGADEWVDMRTLRPISPSAVRASVRRAGLLVVRGSGDVLASTDRQGPLWRWPAAASAGATLVPGDWYLVREAPASPLAAGIAGLEWDSLPPLTAIQVAESDDESWVGVTAQLARRGRVRPVVLGRGSGADRELVTVGTGLWRWAFRGGAGLEAARTLLAAGVDWLLQSEHVNVGSIRFASGPAVARGTPLVVEWVGATLPDSAVIRFADSRSPRELSSTFGADGRAAVSAEPGIYRWVVEGTDESGVAVVEEYSDEFPARPVAASASGIGDGRVLAREVFLRQRWWLFLAIVLVSLTEWGWRQRRGLP